MTLILFKDRKLVEVIARSAHKLINQESELGAKHY